MWTLSDVITISICLNLHRTSTCVYNIKTVTVAILLGVFALIVMLGNGNALVSINVVALRRARLVLGWVYHLGI